MARPETVDAALKNPDDCTELFLLHVKSTHAKLKALPPAFGKLKKLEKLMLTNLPEGFTFPEEMGELSSLKMLSLSSVSWNTLPDWLFRLGNLEELDVMGAFVSVPDQITRLGKLRSLRLWSQHWRGYPEVVCKLVDLTSLTVDGSSFRELPKSFGDLVNLRELELERMGLTALPDSLAKMKKLTKLSLSGNQLTELPAKIGDMTSLVELDVSENQLTELPRSIGKLQKLETLDVRRNRLTSLPDEIGQLRSLADLTLYENGFTDLPASMAKLGKLTKLDLHGNPFTELPAVVCQLANLDDLRIGGQRGPIGAEKGIGPLRSLPAAIGKLRKLRILDANYGYLEALPPEIGQCAALANFYLRRNTLRELPAEIGKLSSLTYLALEENLLEAVPETLAACKTLRELNLTGNTFPTEEIAKLQKLKKQLPRCELGMPREAKAKAKKKTAAPSAARLSEAVVKQLARLGAKLASPAKIPTPAKVKIGDEEYLMPEALRQLDADVKWPRRAHYKGEVNDFELWNVQFGGVSAEPLAEYQCVHHGAYALLATIDTGNMMLLVSLEDKKPEDPLTYWLDHDNFDLHEPSGFERLSKVLSQLSTEK